MGWQGLVGPMFEFSVTEPKKEIPLTKPSDPTLTYLQREGRSQYLVMRGEVPIPSVSLSRQDPLFLRCSARFLA